MGLNTSMWNVVFLQKPPPSLGSPCHSGLLLYVLDLCIFRPVCLPLLPGLRRHFFLFAPVRLYSLGLNMT